LNKEDNLISKSASSAKVASEEEEEEYTPLKPTVAEAYCPSIHRKKQKRRKKQHIVNTKYTRQYEHQ
jgi:hypothetical protein